MLSCKCEHKVDAAVKMPLPARICRLDEPVVRTAAEFAPSPRASGCSVSGGSHCSRVPYPAHSMLLMAHCWQPGRPSSHLSLRPRQVQHPVKVLDLFRKVTAAGAIAAVWNCYSDVRS